MPALSKNRAGLFLEDIFLLFCIHKAYLNRTLKLGLKCDALYALVSPITAFGIISAALPPWLFGGVVQLLSLFPPFSVSAVKSILRLQRWHVT